MERTVGESLRMYCFDGCWWRENVSSKFAEFHSVSDMFISRIKIKRLKAEGEGYLLAFLFLLLWQRSPYSKHSITNNTKQKRRESKVVARKRKIHRDTNKSKYHVELAKTKTHARTHNIHIVIHDYWSFWSFILPYVAIQLYIRWHFQHRIERRILVED